MGHLVVLFIINATQYGDICSETKYWIPIAKDFSINPNLRINNNLIKQQPYEYITCMTHRWKAYNLAHLSICDM